MLSPCTYICLHLAILLLYTGKIIVIQERLLEPQYSEMKPDDQFLQSFAGVVGNDWPYLASLLSLSTRDLMEEMKRENKTSSSDQALIMLRMWNSNEEATYGKLCGRLTTVLLIQ